MHIVTCECSHYIIKYLDKNGNVISFLHRKKNMDWPVFLCDG